MRIFIKLGITLTVLFCLASCEQDEGLGGNASITGNLIEKQYNDDYSLLLSEGNAKNEDIFLLFGDDSTIGEDTETSYSGNFSFANLWPGTYTLYYYSEDTLTAEREEVEMLTTVKVKAGETVNLKDLIFSRSLDWDEGLASITGQIYLVNYKNTSSAPWLIVKDTSYAQEQEVYITYGDHQQFDDRIRTNFDGTFTFNNLIKGTYTVFYYSEDTNGGTEQIVKSHTIEVTEDEQSTDLGKLIIEQL